MILLFILVMFLFLSHPGLSCVIVLFPHIVFLVPNSCCVGVNTYFLYVIPVSESTPKPYLVFSYFYIFPRFYYNFATISSVSSVDLSPA